MQTGICTQFLVDKSVDFEARDLAVFDNVVTGADGFAFRVAGCHACTVAHNTCWSPAPKAILRILHDAFGSANGCDVPIHNAQLRFADNLFAWPAASTYVIASDEDPANVALDHNLWFMAGGGVTRLGSDIPFAGDPTSLYDVDPKLVAPPTDVSLSANSPARGAGVAVDGVTANFAGACLAAPFDVGAY